MAAPDAGTERVPPHSTEAEQSVIGCVLHDQAAYDVAASSIGHADFFRHEHAVIWLAVAQLVERGKPVDVVTVREAMRGLRGADGIDDALEYLHALMQSVPSASNVAAYARIVRRHSVSRLLIALADRLAAAAFKAKENGEQPEDIANRTVLELLELLPGGGTGDPRRVADLLPQWIDDLNARAEGRVEAIPTGLADVDRLLSGGTRRGELVVIAARPSMGKSALMHTVSRSVAERGPVLVCTMEDSDQMLVARQVAAAGRVNLADIRQPARAPDTMWSGVADGVEALKPLRLYVDDGAALSLADIRRKALNVQRREGDLLMVVVDYLQLMDGDGETRAQALSGIARGLKSLAKQLRCTVLLLSQLNREADKFNGPPRLEHLAESDGVEQAADIIGLLWRQARRNPTPENKHKAQVEFAKHKNGATDTVQLWFDGATQRFASMEAGYGDD